jgi:hypothetical protein
VSTGHSYRHRCVASLLALVGIAVFACAAGAAAAQSPLPPEQSGANQYTEALPGAGGNEPTGTVGVGRGGPPGKAIGKQNAEKLEQLGPEGQAAAELAAEAAPAAAASSPAKGSPSGGNPEGRTDPDGASRSGQILSQLAGSDSGGMGPLLPLVIVLAAGAAVAFLVLRRRATPGRG